MQALQEDPVPQGALKEGCRGWQRLLQGGARGYARHRHVPETFRIPLQDCRGVSWPGRPDRPMPGFRHENNNGAFRNRPDAWTCRRHFPM